MASGPAAPLHPVQPRLALVTGGGRGIGRACALALAAQGWRVMFASAAEQGPHRYPLSALGISEHNIALNDSSFEHWLAGVNPQAVMFDRFMLEEQFGWRVEQACPQALRILDMEDCHALRDARQRCFNAKVPVDAQALNSELAMREMAAIYRCDITLVISEFEMQLLQQHYQLQASLLCYCPFLLDQPVTKSALSFAQRQHFIAIGNFRHAPNWQAVLWLKQQIWPLIRQQLPDAELHIYGAYPPPKATALHNEKQGFLIKGWAENADNVLQSARVFLAPLAFGAGLKGKLLDAMRTGTPSVTTDIGAEGMMLQALGWPGIVANDATAIAGGAVALYQQQQLWQQAAPAQRAPRGERPPERNAASSGYDTPRHDATPHHDGGQASSYPADGGQWAPASDNRPSRSWSNSGPMAIPMPVSTR